MNPCFSLFKKDAKRLKPYIVVFIALLALQLLTDRQYTTRASSDIPLIDPLIIPLIYVSLWVLVAALMHQETPVGNRQYWLTRPVAGRHILIAKLLFVIVFILAPMFFGHICVIFLLGFPILTTLPILLMKEAVFISAVVLPAAALASITRSFVQTALTAIIGLVSVIAIAALASTMHVPDYSLDWGIFRWMTRSLIIAIAFCGSLSVLLIQYSQRRTGLSRILASVTLIGIFLILCLPLGSWVFIIQERFSRKTVGDTVARITFDATRYSGSLKYYSNPLNRPKRLIRIPIHIEGLPAEMLSQNAAVQFIVKADKTGEWHSPYRTIPLLQDTQQPDLPLFIDPAFYDRAKDSPVHISGFVDMILLESVPIWCSLGDHVPGAGVFWNLGCCLTPWPRAHLTSLPSQATQPNSERFSVKPEECAPWPTEISPRPLTDNNQIFLELEPGVRWRGIPLARVRPVTYVRRYFTFSNLLLGGNILPTGDGNPKQN
jgi:hypothetical protein